MITHLLKRFVGELICSSRDGSVSLTRLAAVTAHASAAQLFVFFNVRDLLAGQQPNFELWIIYLGFATGHAVYDKTLMLTKAGKTAAPAAGEAP